MKRDDLSREEKLRVVWGLIGTIYMWAWVILIPLSALACACAFLYYLFTGKLF